MTQAVFCDEHGIIHYREFEPATWCGESVVRLRTGGNPRTIQKGAWLAAFGRNELPQVTCMTCIATAGPSVVDDDP